MIISRGTRQVLILLTLLLLTFPDYAQPTGSQYVIKSKILKEDREILISLPEDYNPQKAYDVLYQLDGSPTLMKKSASTVKRLSGREGLIPDLIIIQLVNTNRPRDMWPINTKYYPEPNLAGANEFLLFIENELIPYVEENFSTTDTRIICGQSLSGVFTLYAFLSNPGLFTSFIVCSGAFPDSEDYFTDLSSTSFQNKNLYTERKLFITHGLKDPLDKEGTVVQQMNDFLGLARNMLPGLSSEFKVYKNAGHIPRMSLYDGLKFVYQSKE